MSGWTHAVTVFSGGLHTLSHALHEFVEDVLPHIFEFLAIAFAGYIAVFVITMVLGKLMRQAGIPLHVSRQITSVIGLIFYGVAAFAALLSVGIDSSTLITTGGLLGVAISWIVSSALGNLASGYMLNSTDVFQNHHAIVVNGRAYEMLRISDYYTEMRPLVRPPAPEGSTNIVDFTELYPNTVLASGVIGCWWHHPRTSDRITETHSVPTTAKVQFAKSTTLPVTSQMRRRVPPQLVRT